LQIRSANLDDIRAIEQIERSAPSSWSQSLIISELHQSKAIQLVAFKLPRDSIIGWCCARLPAPEAELLKITVIPHFRRSGAGSLLLHHLINSCDRAGCNEIFLEVREKNITARNFYKKVGFEQRGIRKKYYSEPADNAIILRKTW
jgi:ribosomal-protein-alanine acetyltransferase